MRVTNGLSEWGQLLSPFVLLLGLNVSSCGEPIMQASTKEEGYQVVDSFVVDLGFEFIRRNSGFLNISGKPHFYFADLESAKRIVVYDSSFHEIKNFTIDHLVERVGELAGVGIQDTNSFWLLTKYTNELLHCTNDSVVTRESLMHSSLPLRWTDTFKRSQLMATSNGLSVGGNGDMVFRVDWEVPPSCPIGEVDCCYFDSIRYRPLAVHMRTDEAGALTLTYALDSFFHRTVPGHEVSYLAAGLGFSRWGDRFAAFTSWSDRVMIGELDDPFSARTVRVSCANSKSKANPVPCMNVGNGDVLNERLSSEGHVVQIDWDRGKNIYYLVVLHDRAIEGSADWDFSIVQYDSSWVKVEETTFIDSAYDPGRCYLHPQGFLMGRLTGRGAKRGLLHFDLVEL
jgi:hypothetical protein